MAVRRESVVLSLEDHFSTGMVKAAAATALLEKRLDALDGASVQTQASVRGSSREIDGLTTSANKSDGSINQLTGRLRLLADVGATVGPALVPIGALAVPAIAGLSTQLGVAAVAGGTAMLAFQGVGDALGALNTYQLKPTGENLAKLNDKLDALGPAGEVFVRRLQEMRGEFQGLQDIAQQNMFPGLTDGIESVISIMPALEGVIGNVSTALGGLFADAGADFASPEWLEFFAYLEREAGPILEQTGKTIGNLFEGVTNMVMAFDPISDDFVSGFLRMSESFVAWSDGLDSSEGFQKFVDYIRQSGPQAMETLGAIGNALVEFITAVAPVGAVVLPILEALADAFAAIAGSEVGTPLIAAAAAMAALSRATDLYGKASRTSFGAKQVGSIKGLTAALDTTNRSYERATTSVSAFAKAEEKRAAAVRGGLATLGKSAALVGGLAVATSGAADGLGLTNTASLALMGTMAGPWGAALGGGAGLLLDMKGAADSASEALDQIVKPKTLQDLAALEAQIAKSRKVTDDLATPAGFLDLKDFFGDLPGLIDMSVAERQKIEAEGDAWMASMTNAFTVVGMGFGEDFKDDLGRNVLPTLEELDAAARRAAPAMQALGISAEDLAAMDHDELVAASREIAEWTTHADSAAGRTETLAGAFRDLDSDMVGTATSAEVLKGALEALLGPGLNVSAATDAWRGGLRNLNDELAKNNKSLVGNTDGADKNRAAIRDLVGSSMELLTAQANNGVGAKQLAENLKGQRRAILDAGEAAGISKKDMNDYLNTLGLTPKTIKTIVDAVTEAAENDIDRTQAKLDALRDKNIYVTTTLRTVGSSPGFGPDDNAGDGATVPKTGKPYADRHLYMLADGEEVTSNRHGQADRYRPALKAINSNAPRSVIRGMLADGGTAGSAAERLDVLNAEQAIRELIRSLKADGKNKLGPKARELAEAELAVAKAQLREAEKNIGQTARDKATEASDAQMEKGRAEQDANQEALDAFEQAFQDMLSGQEKATNEWLSVAESMRDSVAAQMEATAAGTTAGFQSGLFGDSSKSIWGTGGAGPFGALTGDIAGLNARGDLQSQLAAAGLDGDALSAALTEGSNQDLAALLAGGRIQEFENLFNQRAALTASVGTAAGQAAYGAQFATLSTDVAALTAELARINGLQSPTSADAAAGYAMQGATIAASVSTAVVNGFQTVARRGTGGY